MPSYSDLQARAGWIPGDATAPLAARNAAAPTQAANNAASFRSNRNEGTE